MEKVERREIRYDGIHCNLVVGQLSRDIVVLKISGMDVGEFGEAPMLALENWLIGSHPVQLFIDARDVRGTSIDVSGEWAKWLDAHKMKFKTVTMLAGSRFIQITADFVRRFANLEGIMRICTEPEVFDAALADALRWQ
jgi:hypothetical protein